jgi:hypothetical protein
LLNSTKDVYSDLDGRELVKAKVSELVIMGGSYPSGHSYNFWGSGPGVAAHVINAWEGRMTFLTGDVGKNVLSGTPLMSQGPETDPVRMAYIYYTYNHPRSSWDPLTLLYAANGLDDLFEFRKDSGRNHIEFNGSNQWIEDPNIRNQFVLKLKMDNQSTAARVDQLFLDSARKFDVSGVNKLESNFGQSNCWFHSFCVPSSLARYMLGV